MFRAPAKGRCPENSLSVKSNEFLDTGLRKHDDEMLVQHYSKMITENHAE